jgi:hypothetical protein
MKQFLTTVATVAAVIFGIPICLASYQAVDDSGWILHRQDTPVFINGEWLDSEIRYCDMYTWDFWGNSIVPTAERTLTCFNPPGDNPALPPHTLPVRYYGRIDRRVKHPIVWKCQRGDSELTCHAIN